MRIATVREVLSSIELHAAREPGGVIAFDGDGTLWSGDVGDDFFDALLRDGPILPVAHAQMVAEARAEGVDPGGSPRELAARIHAAYAEGRFPEERVFELMAWIFAGWSRSDVDRYATRLIDAMTFDARLHPEAIAVVRGAAARGIPVHVVSASPRAIVEAAARRVGVSPECIAATLDVCDDAGRLLPEVKRPSPYGAGKVTRLRAQIGDRPLYAAFGDNAFDVPLLAASHVPVAIRPKLRLRERASDVAGLVELEPG